VRAAVGTFAAPLQPRVLVTVLTCLRRLHAAVPEADGRERFVSVIRHGGVLYCLDSTCYHAGGPLLAGDIEDVDGRACVSCPWHAYKVTLDTGEKLYRSTEKGPDGKLVPAGIKSVGKRQRVHAVKEVPGEGIFVQLLLGGAPVDSDSYAHNAACGARAAGSPAPTGLPRSGDAFRASGRGAPLHSSRGADGHAPL
jgi:nitrite reductase/ring-hydroxylating ferredoxin subunit